MAGPGVEFLGKVDREDKDVQMGCVPHGAGHVERWCSLDKLRRSQEDDSHLRAGWVCFEVWRVSKSGSA